MRGFLQKICLFSVRCLHLVLAFRLRGCCCRSLFCFGVALLVLCVVCLVSVCCLLFAVFGFEYVFVGSCYFVVCSFLLCLLCAVLGLLFADCVVAYSLVVCLAGV